MSNGTGCPACAGKVVTDLNRLSLLFPKIASEWDYSKNTDTPDNVSFGSNKKRWWICPEGHSYFSFIYDRANGKGCKQCSYKQKESKIATQLKHYCIQNLGAIDEYEIYINDKTGSYLPYDIYISRGENPEINGVYIEVNDGQHYRISGFNYLQARKNNTTPREEFEYQKKKDRMKRKFARKNGVYIEIDLRKIKSIEEAIEHVTSKIS